jgi:hypothetical protein
MRKQALYENDTTALFNLCLGLTRPTKILLESGFFDSNSRQRHFWEYHIRRLGRSGIRRRRSRAHQALHPVVPTGRYLCHTRDAGADHASSAVILPTRVFQRQHISFDTCGG